MPKFVMTEPAYSGEPENKEEFTAANDQQYTRFARAYDVGVKWLPVWKTWLGQAIPHIRGPRVLEVSFGTGHLLTQYAGNFETSGIDFNQAMVSIARKNLMRAGLVANLQQGNVESLPYEDEAFDSVVNTMAFSGYPDPTLAMSEMHRVVKRGGRLILIDVNYPADGNWPGTRLTNLWKFAGDIIRNMNELFREFDFDSTDEEIGGFGSVHLYLATRR